MSFFVEMMSKLFHNQRKISKRKSKKTGQQCRKGRRWLRGLDLILIWISESLWILSLFDVLLYIKRFFGAQHNEQTWQWFNVDVAAGTSFFTDEHYLVFGRLEGCKRLPVGLVVMWKWPFSGMQRFLWDWGVLSDGGLTNGLEVFHILGTNMLQMCLLLY